MSIKSFLRVGLFTLTGVFASGVITACSPVSETNQHNASTKASNSLSSQSIILYSGQVSPDVHVVIESPDAKQELVGDKIEVSKVAGSSAPNSVVSVVKSDKNISGDALTFFWKDSWRAALNFQTTNAVDLTPFTAGVVTFDLNVIQLAKGGLAFKVKCGDNCERKVPFLLPGRDMIGKGWQHLAVPLQCFIREGDNLSAFNFSFLLETGGEGTISAANVRLEKSGQANVDCTDYKTIAVTPSMLTEWWSVNWWEARHQQKLDEIKTLKAAKKNIELIFIGDSITHNWEKDGFNVWNKNYKKYNAISLGFGGDRTENILWRLQHGEVDGINPKVAVLMFGTNNTGQRLEDPKYTVIGIKRDIDELQQRLPNTKILLLAIFPRDEKPDAQMRQMNNDINSTIANYADNKKIFFLNINKFFLDDKGILSKNIMPDLLHPNEQGYEIWAKAMAPTLQTLMRK